jgi:hypothetical protein
MKRVDTHFCGRVDTHYIREGYYSNRVIIIIIIIIKCGHPL